MRTVAGCQRLEAAPVFLLTLLMALSACSSGSREPEAAIRVIGGVGELPGRFRMPRAVAVDSKSGNVYVVDRSGRIQRFDVDGNVLQLWYLPEYEFGQPVGLALEADGNLLVNDSHYSRILRYSPDGGEILARWGSVGLGPGQFTFGRDVVVDAAGHIYAGDYGGMNDRIQKFHPDGRFIREWGGRGEEPGRFQRPQGMTIERRGSREFLLIADCANHRVQRFTLEGELVNLFGSVGRGAGEMRYPSSVTTARDGTIFVSEWGNNRIQAFDGQGNSLGFWGKPGRAVGELSTPWDIAVGPDDRLYVADYGNHRVQIFSWSPTTERPVATTAREVSPAASVAIGISQEESADSEEVPR